MTGAHNPGNGCFKSLRKQPTFSDATTGFPAKWRLRSTERRNSILMTRHYPDLGRAFDWLKQRSHVTRQVTGRSTIQFWAQLFEGRLALNPGLNLARVSFSFVQKHFLGQCSLIFIEHRIINLLTKIIKLNLPFKLSYLNSSFALTLGYLNPAWTTRPWVITRHQYGISAIVSQTSFRGETSAGVGKCRLIFQAIVLSHKTFKWKKFILGKVSFSFDRNRPM